MKIIGARPVVEGEGTYLTALHQSMAAALTPGPALLDMNTRVLSSLTRYIDAIGPKQQPRGLYRWVKDVFTLSIAEAMYGAKNPISDDPKLVDCL